MCGGGCAIIVRAIRRQDGAAMVEAALSMILLMTATLGVIQMTLAFYTSNVIDLAARDASRWAAVRGSGSCAVLSTFPYCNYGPTGYGTSGTYTAGTATDPVEIYVRGLGYPGLSGVTASATWYTETLDANGASQWTAASSCGGATDGNGQPCNGPGHMVTVTVTYSYPLQVPFISNRSFSMNSTSSMVISE